MKMSERDVKYGPQPAYNESYVPTGPPSYSEAVGTSNPNKSLYPQTFPPQYNAAPVVPQVVRVPPAVVTVPVCVGPNPSTVTCPNCNSSVTTKIKTVSQKSAHIACCLLFCFGCCLCSCIPYCMKSFQDIHHYCPVCNAFIGFYKN